MRPLNLAGRLAVVVCLLGALWGLPVYAELSYETPAVFGEVVLQSEFEEDLFLFLAVSEDEDENIWVKLDEHTFLRNQFGDIIDLNDEDVFGFNIEGSILILMCYEHKSSFIEVHEAIIILNDDGDEDFGEEDDAPPDEES